MEKDKEKAMYESPVTKETPVNLESGICGASQYKGKAVNVAGDGSGGEIEKHTISDGGFSFSSSWE